MIEINAMPGYGYVDQFVRNDDGDGALVRLTPDGARDVARRLLVASMIAEGSRVPHMFHVDNIIDNQPGGM